MHADVVRDTPGICPKCGMNLVPTDKEMVHGEHGEGVGFNKHEGHSTASFLEKCWIALALSVPIFFYSEMARMVFGLHAPEFFGYQYVLLILASIIFFYCGAVFLMGAYRELRARLPGMMTLISLAITAAYVYSFVSILLGMGHDLLFELSSLVAIMLLGHWIEMRSVQSAQGALRELSKLLPDQAEVFVDGATKIVPLSALKVGDVVLIKPGAKIPADGTIIEGRSELNESILTGESKPVEKRSDDGVIAGSLNGDGSLKVEITKIGEKTFLAGVMRLVSDAQVSKSRLQMLSDRAAFYLTIIAIASGALTFFAWIFMGAGGEVAIERLVAVLVITCPHALGLAIPLVAAISTTMAARNGLLVRQRSALELARSVDTVLFDKTGTLTRGDFTVISATSDEVLALAAAVEAQSEHPMAAAIVREAKARGLSYEEVHDFRRIPGQGAEALMGGTKIFVGHRGGDDLVVKVNGQMVGSISLGETIRPEAKEAVDLFKKMNVRVYMITGDSKEAAAGVARALGIDDFFARVLPGEKAEKVKMLQDKGHTVAMVGDGVNDAPALAQADLGIAIGAGTNVAIESAGIILVRNDPRDIVKIINLSRFTYTKMMQNLFWATGYNVIAIPLAAGVFASKGFILQPALAAVFMSASTVIVSFNALLLRGRNI
jgi:Cu2+-exporting ATPase